MSAMLNYLQTMDKLKARYIDEKKREGETAYPFLQFHYYEQVNYAVEEGIQFKQLLVAVKLARTTILFVDPQTKTKVYLSDSDIAWMIKNIKDEALRIHILSSLQKAIDGKKLSTLTFSIQNKKFRIKGIAFDAKFNDTTCENPADISINGNDFIALINLILEKERTDKDPNKLIRTAKMYIG
jgi:hypothetical protein